MVTPTLNRPEEVDGLLDSLTQQLSLPFEFILVDGAPKANCETEEVVRRRSDQLPFNCLYIRHGGGTAIQRNKGIEEATGDYIAFVDDDVRLDTNFLSIMSNHLIKDQKGEIGGIVGYRTNKHFSLQDTQRWRWYRRLRLLKTYEPGRYDFETGIPINANLQPSYSGLRDVDFMTTACAVWRRAVFDGSFRFDPFFRDFGVLEDAHLSLRAGKQWRLVQCGDAHCTELSSPRSRENRRKIGYKGIVNYYYVFHSIVSPLTLRHKLRFWRFQGFELFRMVASVFRRRRAEDMEDILGRLTAIVDILTGRAF